VVGVPAQIVLGKLVDKSVGAMRIMLGCVTVEKASDIERV
jgi:hypothetical protein